MVSLCMLLLLCTCTLQGATGAILGEVEKDGGSMTVMSYNLYGWNALVQNPWKAENVYKAIRQVNPDILGAQECEGKEYDVAANIGSDYSVADSASAGHAIFYKRS